METADASQTQGAGKLGGLADGRRAGEALWNKRSVAESIRDLNRRQKKYEFHMKE